MINHSQKNKGCPDFDYTRPDWGDNDPKGNRKGLNEWHFISPTQSEIKLNAAISSCDAEEFQDRMHGMQDWYIHKEFMKTGHREELYHTRKKRDSKESQRYYELPVPGNSNSVYAIHPDVVPKGGVLRGVPDAPWDQANIATGEWVKKWEKKCCCKNKKWEIVPESEED